jgi:hypothetical protein
MIRLIAGLSLCPIGIVRNVDVPAVCWTPVLERGLSTFGVMTAAMCGFIQGTTPMLPQAT